MRTAIGTVLRWVLQTILGTVTVWLVGGYWLARHQVTGISPVLSVVVGGGIGIALALATWPRRVDWTKVPVFQRMLDDVLLETRLWGDSLKAAEGRVCLIEVDGQPRGTGFLVEQDLVVTCYHVVDALMSGSVASDAVRVRFGHVLELLPDGRTGNAPGVERPLAADWRVFASPPPQPQAYSARSSSELDLAVLRLQPAPSFGARGKFTLCPSAASGSFGKGVLILQHPLGGTLKHAHVTTARAESISPKELNIAYAVSTLPGASGAPVLNSALQLIGMHQAGGPSREKYNLGLRGDVLYGVLADAGAKVRNDR